MDYLSRLPEDRTPETFHDFRPSHYQRPSYLIEAADIADRAWKAYDEVIEDELFSLDNEYRQPRYDLVEQARELAEEAATFYSEQYQRWQDELAEKLEVME